MTYSRGCARGYAFFTSFLESFRRYRTTRNHQIESQHKIILMFGLFMEILQWCARIKQKKKKSRDFFHKNYYYALLSLFHRANAVYHHRHVVQCTLNINRLCTTLVQFARQLPYWEMDTFVATGAQI